MSGGKKSRENTFWQLWGAPIVLALLTTFGLTAALLGTGAWHWSAWTALLVPVAVCAHYSLRDTSRG